MALKVQAFRGIVSGFLRMHTPAHPQLSLAMEPAMQSAAALGADGAGGEGFSPVAALKDMLSGWFMAVPKKKRSGARRGQRTAPKYLRWDHSIHACIKCGEPRRPHTYCDTFNCGRADDDTAVAARTDGVEDAKTAN
ncbi:hypothetical protein T484DRAFT_2870745 [Baffinella frigidus]|nr:hypothetical protein T484DRAFT_2870745 [Cryptophyta sp. CCMP2293]